MLEDLPPSFLDKLLSPLSQETSNHHINTTTTTTTTTNISISSKPSAVDVYRTARYVDGSAGLTVSLNTSTTAWDQPLSPAAQEAERKRRAQREKLGRLAAYGRAPALSPLPQVMSPAASRAFKPPNPHGKGKR
ncbi:hypothetical protein ACOMHN_058814 [Nucella lapillus]